MSKPTWKRGFARSKKSALYSELREELLGVWHFHLGQTGTLVYDLSGNGWHGFFGSNKNVTNDWNFDQGDLAVESTSSNVFHGIRLPDDLILHGRSAMTMVSRVVDTGSGTERYFSKSTAGSAGNAQRWMLSGDGVGNTRYRLRTDTAGSTRTLVGADGTRPLNEWFTVAGSYDGSTMRHWFNGQETASQAADGLIDDDVANCLLYLSANHGYNSGTLIGWHGWSGLWGRALTAKEQLLVAHDPYAVIRRKRVILVAVPSIGEAYEITPDASITLVDDSVGQEAGAFEIIPNASVTLVDDSTAGVSATIIPDAVVTLQDDSTRDVRVIIAPDASVTLVDNSTSSTGQEFSLTPDARVTLQDDSVRHITPDITPNATVTLQDDSIASIPIEFTPNASITLHDDSIAGGSLEFAPDATVTLRDDSTRQVIPTIVPDARVTLQDDSASSGEVERIPDASITLVDDSTTNIERAIVPNASVTLVDSSTGQSAGAFVIVPDARITLVDDSASSGEVVKTPDASITLVDESVSSGEVAKTPDASVTLVDDSTALAGGAFVITPDARVTLQDDSTAIAGSAFVIVPDACVTLMDESTRRVTPDITPNAVVTLQDDSIGSGSLEIVPDARVTLVDNSMGTPAGVINFTPDARVTLVDDSTGFEDTISKAIVKSDLDLENCVLDRLLKNWDAAGNQLPVYSENQEYQFEDQFAILYILRQATVPQSILGQSKLVDRHEGLIQINVYTPIGAGTSQGLYFAQELGKIFQHTQFNGIFCQEMSVNSVIGFQTDRNLHTVTIAFYWDEFVQGKLVA